MNREDAREYSESLAQIGHGWWRQMGWAVRQDIPGALGMGRRQWAETYHGYMRMAVPDRQEAVAELESEGLNNSEIADVLGVDERTVRRDLNDLDSANAEQDQDDGPEAEGAGATDDLDSANAEQDQDDIHALIEGEPEPFEEFEEEFEPVPEPEPEPAKPSGAHVGKNTGDNEWYTPAEYIKAAKAVMRTIDLDPASSDEANEVVGAYDYYTQEQDGLTQPWEGRVWLNPPYAQPLVDRFCSRLAREYRAGAVTEACVLVNNATETAWFQAVAEGATAMCFPRGRVKFWHPSKEAVPLQGQAVIYLGENVAGFRAEFTRFGFVVTL